MPPFDLDGYFANRFGNAGTDKLDALARASQDKVEKLMAFQAAKAEMVKPNAPTSADSWVTKLGLDPSGKTGEAVNLAASFASGATRVAGQLASLPSNIMAVMDELHLGDAENAAYTRYKQNMATPEDMALLSKVTQTLNGTNIPKPGAPTNLQLFERAAEARKTGLGITEAMDTSSIVHQGKRDKLNKDLGKDFETSWEQTKQGASDLWDGELLTGSGNLASGLGKLIFNAGAAAVTNPAAASEYIVENVPQLVGGLAGKAGKVALTASNVGYGADLYQQGIKRYQDANDGALPSVEQRQKMAMHAAGAVLAEQASDLISLSAIKSAGKAVKEGTENITRTGFKESLKNTGKAGLEGLVSEAPTEGYQTYAEGQATLKPASPLEIYQGTAIGGIAGAGLTGGGRAVAEAMGATPEKAAARAEEQASTNTFVENAQSNNADYYLKEGSKDYDPTKAVAVLFANSQSADTSAEDKHQNVEKAHSIVADLESKREELQSQLDQMTPAGIQQRINSLKSRLDTAPPELASRIQDMVSMLQEDLANFDPKSVDQKVVQGIKNQISKLDKHISESTKLRDQLEIQNKPQEADIEAAVANADTTLDTTSQESVDASKASADHVVSLAMAHPESFSDDHLNRLVNNQNNGLSAEQRSYLRSMAESRIAENAMKTLGIVENEVMQGDPAKKQLGIADYKQRMQEAVRSNNADKASTALHMLGKFADAHQQKLDTFLPLFNKAKAQGTSVKVVPTKRGWELASNQNISLEALRNVGGLEISPKSSKLIGQIKAESGALNAARAQLQSAYNLKFGARTAVNQSAAATPVNSSVPSTAQVTAPKSSTVNPVNNQSSTPSNQSTVNSTVNSQNTSTNQYDPLTGEAWKIVQQNPKSTAEDLQKALGIGFNRANQLLDTLRNTPAPVANVVSSAPPAPAKKKRKRIEPKDYQNIVGAILRVTGGAGIHPSMAQELLKDKIKESSAVRAAFTRQGQIDMGDLITLLREEEGFTQLETEADLAEMLQNHAVGIPGYSASRIEEEAAKDKARKEKSAEQEYRHNINQEAKEKGIKQARGKRTIEHVLADLALWEEKQSALEAEEERLAIQAEATFSEGNEIELMLELANLVGYSLEEIDNVRNENRKSKERAAEAAQGEAEASRGNRTNVSQTESGKSTNGEGGKLSVFQQVVDVSDKKFSEIFKEINLIAHNLTQKLGKNAKTQRPLVAVKDFLSAWKSGEISEKDLENFTGTQLTAAQRNLLNHFKHLANQWLPNITNNLVKGQLSAGVKIKREIAEANKLPPKEREAALEKINQKIKDNEAGKAQFNPEMRYTNPIQYLIELNESGKADMEENIKTAIAAAAFTYVAENAKAPQLSTEEGIKAMFGLSDYDSIGRKLVNTIAPLGNPERAVIISLGQRVTQALGLSAKQEASQEFLARLQSDLGAHVMKLLVDQGIMERSVVPGAVISAGLKGNKNHDASKQGSMAFLRMARTQGKTAKQRKLKPVAESISEMAAGTQGILGKLFGVEAQVNEPSWKPIKVKQQTTANTDQAIPDALKKIVAHENSVANYVREDVWNLLQGLGEDAFLEMAGYIEPDESKMHKSSMTAAEVSNEALRRELDAAIEYFGRLENPEAEGGSPLGLKQPLYLAHSVWKQQRVGIDGVINPQSSKIHRWMLTRSDWKTKVDSTDAAMMQNFFLRVAEGLGVKTDKQSNERSMDAVRELLNTESKDEKTRDKAIVFQKAVDALIASRQPGAEMTAEQSAAIVAGVKEGDEKMHSMDALIALANAQEAQQKVKKGEPFSFEVQMMGEVDGVTNGPMLSHLLLGAGANAKALLNRLNKGGFFQEGSGFQNYNVWRGKPAHSDLYESTIGAVIKHLSKQTGKSGAFAELQKITGLLYNEATQSIEKDGRNIIKTPLTAMLFGSTVDGAVESMFQDFLSKAYKGFEKIAKLEPEEQQKALDAYVDNLNSLLRRAETVTTPIAHNTLADFLANFEFSESQEAALSEVFKSNLGESVKETMKEEFSEFLDARNVINDTANATFGIYNAAYQAIRQNVIADLIKSGDIAQGKDGKPLHDLTAAQEALIDARIAKLNPVVHTYMANQSKNAAESGLHISKSSRQLSKEKMYQNTSRFGQALPSTKDENGKTVPGALSLINSAYQRILDAPGVAMVPMMIHSLDSSISHMALMGRQVLNVHDAHGTGLGNFAETAQALNKATWKAVLGYSPTAEMRNSFRDVLFGMDSLLKSGENTDQVIANLKAYMEELGDKYGTWIKESRTMIPMDLDRVLTKVAVSIYNQAYQADKTKYEVMSQLAYVDQYALEGGQYTVTDADRAEAASLLKAMGENFVPGSVWGAIDRINAAVLGKTAPRITAEYGTLGQSSIASDIDLVRFFEDSPVRSAKDVVKQIEGKLSPANKAVLNKIKSLLDPAMPIEMITARTPKGATLSKEANARGWFAYKGDVSAVYVLSPEFKASGLTPELLVHELLHAALARTIANPQTKEAKAFIASMEDLAARASEFIDANPELKAKYPFKLDVHELVSWGMSDLGFQTDVLSQIPMTKSSVSNRLMSAMMGFIKAISKLLGLPMTVKNAQGQMVDNGLASLIQDVSGLIEQAKNGTPKNNDGTFSAAMAAVQNLSTLGIYEALDEQKVSPTFDEHLRKLITDVVSKLHGPFGTLKEVVESNQNKTPKELWAQAQGIGAAPFGSAALAAGIPMNDQVAFVLEQVEATVQGALNANPDAAYDVTSELSKLYQEARSKLANSNTLSPALKDFLFKMEGNGDKTNHLARFVALGLAHPEVNAALQMASERASLTTSGSFAHRLESVFQKVLEWFNGRLTHTFAGQQVDEKLQALVGQLVSIEAKRKEPMLQRASALDFVENSLKQGSAKLKGKVEQLGRSKWIKDRKSGIIRASGAVVSTIAGERTDALLGHIQNIRDQQMTQGHGLAMGIINEIRGTNDGNKVFHRLIREAKMREGTREDLIVHTGNVALESFANKGQDLSVEDRAALTAGILRTDIAALLDHHSMAEIHTLLTDSTALNAEIARLENALAPFRKARGFYERSAKNLAYKMATGNVKGQHLLMNATNIARLSGTGYENQVTAAEAEMAAPIIDQLTSLYAFKYMDPKHSRALNNVLATENARGNQSGVEMLLKLHKSLQNQSKERLFEGSEALMMKGYTPEIYDPKKEVLVATEAEGAKLVAQGYIQGNQVAYDPMDPDRTPRFIYKRDGGGLRPWLSTIFSYTGETAKGSRSKTDNVKSLTEWTANKQDLRNMAAAKQANMLREFRYDPNYDPSKVQENFAAPVLNAEGKVTDYRYLMREENKDDLLNRDNRFDKVLGFFAGNIYDKESTKENNRKAVQALYDQYQADFATRSASYRTVGLNSQDPELRDIYRMLPEDTKKAIKEIWGSEHMMVRSDLMDINFGYRKSSVTDAFHKEQKNALDAMFVGLMKHVMGEKAEYNLQRAEDIWQEIVAEAKEILVIKNLSTLIGNIGSNISLLYWQGVPFKDMVRYHRIALKGISSYRQDSAALIELETKLEAGVIATSRAEMRDEIARLKDALARNPVKELIDAGLMPSIVEDVSPDDDMYSYKSRLTHYVDEHTNNLNKHVIGAARTVYMAKDTKMYQALHHATQLSDFVARYALYMHTTTRKENPLSKEDAVQLASDAFINYDLPSHRKLQYLNDMGFVMFTKYYLRIQKVIAHLYAENPGRALALLVTDHFFANAPLLTDSGFVHKLGNNPFNIGAFAYPGVLDELGTIKLGSAVIK